METQNFVSGRKLSVLVISMTEAASSMRKVGRIIPILSVLSTLAGCWSPTAEQQVESVAQLPTAEQQVESVAQPPTAKQQVEAVAKRLQELNPGFDGQVTPTFENGVVVGLRFCTDNVTDISPVRSLVSLEQLHCDGSGGFRKSRPGSRWIGSGKLADLSPLKGMPLTQLDCHQTQVSELTPLSGMPLTSLNCGMTQVSDLTPLRGMLLTELDCGQTQVPDLTPLSGMPLKSLSCGQTQVSDLTPLSGMPLTSLACEQTQVSDLTPLKGLKLTVLNCKNTQVFDLTPLSGMPLTHLTIHGTQVFDLSPLEGMTLNEFTFTAKNITQGLDVVRQMTRIHAIGLDDLHRLPPDKFWTKYDNSTFGKPITKFNNSVFKQWVEEVAALPAEKQLEAVSKKLQELNPDFDGKETHKIEDGVLTELQFVTDNVEDISPVRALPGLKNLTCAGTNGDGKLSDLSPLRGMLLTALNIEDTQVSDLSPIKDMPLTFLRCKCTRVSQLLPLQGMSLTNLDCDFTLVSDLSPLKGLRLRELWCGDTQVSDLAPLKGMPLTQLYCFETQVSDLTPLKDMPLANCIASKPRCPT